MALGLWTVWAVLAAVVTSMIMGFVWYGPIFGKAFMRYLGMDALTPEQMKEGQKEAMPGYLVSMATVAVSTVVIAFLFDWAMPGSGYADGWMFGISLGVAGWLAFYVPGTLTGIFFDKRPFGFWAISAGYWGLMGVISGLYVGLLHPGF